MAEPPCPMCRRPADPALRPFCSRRCADVDLGRWMTGQYVVAGEADNDSDETSRGEA